MASDSDKEEEFVNYGTPLEPLEEDEAPRRPVPLHEQTVLDERGRFQRFHGAFTGGFSAGYFNTVGSKEGWTPSTFVSSRQQKADKQHHARPEDFMDEEDLGEHGIAPRQITTSQEFSSGRRDAAAEKARAVGAAAALIPGDTLLEELIRPARSSVGVRLLTRMGWREGQGVGPRVKRKRRQQNPPEPESGVRVYGCSAAPGGSEESEDEDEFAPEDATFAPKDVTPVDFTPRTGRQGLGYRGLDPGLALPGFGPGLGPDPGHVDLFRPQSDSRSRLFGGRQRGSRRGGVAGQAFGVGALEDEDEDVYQRDCMSRYDRELGEEEPGDGLFGWTAPKQYKKTEGSRDASYLGKILEGFTLAQRPPEEKTVFPPPRLPRDYRPVYRGVQVSRLEGVSPALAQALRTSKGHMEEQGPPQGRHQLGSGQRGALLGEDTLTGPSSVMELLRPEDRQRLLRLRSSSSSSQQPPPVAPPVSDLQQEALAAWRGASSSSSSSSSSFKPFEKNPEKQQRYDLYLNRLRQGDAGALDQSLDPTMTEWERSREREEFARASILYRPSSSSLTSRFTRAKQEDEDPPEVKREQEEVDGEAPQAAASMKMFGKLTRETLEWHPDRLLCRRFNVPDPFPGSSLVGLPKIRRDKFSIFNFLSVTDSRQEAAPPPPDSGKKSRWDVSEQMKKSKTGPDQASAEPDRASSEPDRASAEPSEKEEPRVPEEEQQEEQEEESRPPMDLFKAIFASSSEEKSSEEEEEEEEASDAEVKEEEKEEEVSLFTSPPAAPPPSRPAPPAPAASSHRPQEEQQEEFGPKLPPPNSRGGAAIQEVKPSRRSKEKKHKKEKKKKKKKKHKQRHKQQKKSRREESSSSQEEEQEEEEEPAGGAVSTEELLRRLKSLRSGPVQ